MLLSLFVDFLLYDLCICHFHDTIFLSYPYIN
nr:MAG TPA: hypothetical protein [Caudoviricetes sp.]